MRFSPLPLAGAYLLEIEAQSDERGFFARTWCKKEFAKLGLNTDLEQCNLSYNSQRATIRGMHWQQAPFAETKIVRCIQGSVYDVILDLRSDSPTYLHWHALELNSSNRCSLYIPAGFAHGFQSLVDSSELFYQMSTPYHHECSRGARWNDPAFAISWPLPNPIISDRDASHPNFSSNSAIIGNDRQS